MSFQTICRICIEKESGMVSIFESYNFSAHNYEISKVIRDCASVQIQKFDGFSEQICRRCLDHLSKAYSFKKLCELSDYKFRNGLIFNEEIIIKSEFSCEDTKINYPEGGCDTRENSNKLTKLTDFDSLPEVKTEHAIRNNGDVIKEEVSMKLFEIVKCEEQSVSNNSAINTSNLLYKCELCNKSLGTKRSLVRHMEVHAGNRPHLCNICGKTFQQSTHLKQHMRLHTGEKPFKCDVCEKQFSLKCNFVAHYKSHTGEAPHKCDVCGKQFRRNGDLVVHIRLHTGEKPYKCEFCEKTFTDSSSLAKHNRSHTGEKPYKCVFCAKMFSQSSNLAKHVRTHAEQKLFV